MTDLDALTQDLSAFGSFDELLNAPNYRPTIIIRDRRYLTLARAYDAAQAARGDERRAFTAHSTPQVGDPISFYRLGAQRSGRIEKVGTKRLLVSYVTKIEAKLAKKHGRAPARFSCYVPIDSLDVLYPDGSRRGWRVLNVLCPDSQDGWRVRNVFYPNGPGGWRGMVPQDYLLTKD